jgi:hypothetical protein
MIVMGLAANVQTAYVNGESVFWDMDGDVKEPDAFKIQKMILHVKKLNVLSKMGAPMPVMMKIAKVPVFTEHTVFGMHADMRQN